MNTKDNIIFVLSLFPVFIIRSYFSFYEILTIIFLFLIIFIINFFLLKYINQKKYIKLKFFYLSLILTLGIDNHLGLFNGLIQANINFFLKYFEIVYIPAFIILIFILLVFFIILKKTDYQKSSIIFIVTILSIFLFNIFDDSKSYKKIPYFNKQVKNKFQKITLIMIWDEMSGMNSLSSETKIGMEFNEDLKKFFQKYKFKYYTNNFSNSGNSITSIISLLNFYEEIDQNIRNNHVSPSKNYFVEYNVEINKLFEKFNSISVIQNLHINYCNSKFVKKCYQYNPFDLQKITAEVDSFSKIISIWNLNGSILGKFVWRSLKQLELVTSILEPEGEKLFIKNIINYTKKEILSEKYDLIFYHVLVPHKPFGFDKKCEYNLKISNLNLFFNNEKSIKQHNIERKCVVEIMDNFLESLGNLDNKKIYFISDHGSRITRSENSFLSTILGIKNFESKSYKAIKDKTITQKIFKENFNE